jgi:hypothetical protein
VQKETEKADEVSKVNGVVCSINLEDLSEPPQLFLRVVWKSTNKAGNPTEVTTTEPCNNETVMSLPQAQKWVKMPQNLSFARKEARKGMLLHLQNTTTCDECSQYSKVKRGVVDCSKAE